MKKLTITFALGLSLLNLGCVSTITDVGAYRNGTEITQTVLTEIELGSTKSDVINHVGQPHRKSTNKDVDYFYYDYQKISHFTANVAETTVFEFRNGKLVDKYKTGYSGTNTNALLDAASN